MKHLLASNLVPIFNYFATSSYYHQAENDMYQWEEGYKEFDQLPIIPIPIDYNTTLYVGPLYQAATGLNKQLKVS